MHWRSGILAEFKRRWHDNIKNIAFRSHKTIGLMFVLLGLLMVTSAGKAEPDPVAMVGTQPYYSLDEAFTAATTNGGTLSILQNATLTSNHVITKNVIIEGNGKTITVEPNAIFTVKDNGKLTLNKVIIDGGTAIMPSGTNVLFHIDAGSVVLQDTTIQNRNLLLVNGFGSVFQIDSPLASLTMNNSKIMNCKVGTIGGSEGIGAIAIGYDGGSLTINGGEISECGTTLENGPYYGGAIVAFPFTSKGIINISNCVIKDNHSVYGGGIVLAYDCEYSVKNVTFENNTSAKDGGAIFLHGGYNLLPSGLIEDCSFVNNHGRYGGAIYSNTCLASINGCSISRNVASLGGGIFNTGSNITFTGQNIICNNTASSIGADLFNYNGNIELPSATAMNQTFQDTEFVIDGWYDDTSTRWDYEKALTYGNTYLGDTWSINGQKGFIAAFRAHSVKLSGGANATVSGGDTSQAVQSGAITTVTYTAADGYRFEDFPDIVVNGITAKRISETVVTVFGTPNENASITIPDAMKKDDAAAVTVVPQIRTLTYSGSAQELVTAGTAEGGTMQYAQGTNDTSVPAEGWGNSIPKGTDARTYYVWFRIVGDENHNDIEPACLTATIARAVPDVTAPVVRALVYNGSSQKLVTAGAAEGGTMQYALGTNDTTAPAEGWSTSIPKGTDAGTYYVWYRVQGDKNHTDIRPVCIIATVGAEVPKTGDDSSPLLWLGVILVGIMTIVVLRRAGFIGRKQNKGW